VAVAVVVVGLVHLALLKQEVLVVRVV